MEQALEASYRTMATEIGETPGYEAQGFGAERVAATGGPDGGWTAFISRYADRIVLLHIKEAAGERVSNLGRGGINWPLVCAAAPKTAFYVSEHDAPTTR